MTVEQMKEINELYGRGFEALRRLAGFGNLRDFGEAVGMSAPVLSQIERGIRPLRAHEIEWFCKFFAERIEGYSEDTCLEILRRGARSRLRPVAPTGLSAVARDHDLGILSSLTDRRAS